MSTQPSSEQVHSKTIAPLEEVLTYTNENVLHKFMEHFDLPKPKVEDLFRETLKWLWISARSIQDREQGIDAPAMIIYNHMNLMDQMWHTFILFTVDYAAFCDQYFGFFLHHIPTTYTEKEDFQKAYKADPESVKAQQDKEKVAQYRYIYKHLGPQTLNRWNEGFATEFNRKFINEIRKGL